MNKFTKILLFLLTLYFSCTNPFTVREAEQPGINKSSDNYEEPFISETVILNLEYAINQGNITNYEKCFVNEYSSTPFTYKFLHDQRIETNLLNDWTLDDEIQYFSNIINSDTLRSLDIVLSQMLPHQQITSFPDSVWTGFDYDISLTFDDSYFNYKGHTILNLVKNNQGIWAIYYWEDLPSSDNYENSWSLLKLKFR